MEKLVIKKNSKFGNLAIIKEIVKTKRKSLKKRRFLCKCICGNIKEVNLIHLTQGDVVSCGCYIPSLNRLRVGDKNSVWKGGKTISEGYRLLYKPDHPRARVNGYVAEHIVIMEEKLGRPLVKGENVHHINGDKLDNTPNNLELWSTSQPPGQRISDKVKWAKEILILYKDYE